MSRDIAVDNDTVRAGSTECFAAEAALSALYEAAVLTFLVSHAILIGFFDEANFKKENTSFHVVSTCSSKHPPNFPNNMGGFLHVLHVFKVGLRVCSLP